MSTTAKFRAFVAVGADNKLKVDDPVTVVPGIGESMTEKLKTRGVEKVGELMGLLMTNNLDKKAFVAELVEAEIEERYATEAAEALYEKAMQFCSNEYPEKLAGSAGQTGSLNTFLNGKLTTKPLKEGYVPGLGKASVEKLTEKGVGSTVQLMGEFLLQGRSRAKFVELLQTAGGLRKQDLDANDTDGAMLERSLQFCR